MRRANFFRGGVFLQTSRSASLKKFLKSTEPGLFAELLANKKIAGSALRRSRVVLYV